MSLIQSVWRKLLPPAPPASQRLHLAAFGKHPAWDDHLPNIGVDTERLVEFRRAFYVEGIGGNIDAGGWDERSGSLLPFHHVFVACVREECVLGRMWSSRDGKGRASYPMIVCAAIDMDLFRRAGAPILERLRLLEQRCLDATSAEAVVSRIDAAREELRQLVDNLGVEGASEGEAGQRDDPIRALARSDEMGPSHEGLARLLYEIERSMSHFQIRMGTRSSALREQSQHPHHVRVPRCATKPFDALGAWARFLRHEFAEGIPIWLIVPLERTWVDVLVGIPKPRSFACVRESDDGVPLTTDIPYQLDDEFMERVRSRVERADGAEPKS